MGNKTQKHVPADLAFLQGLAQLTAETGVEIAACGCCGSPWIRWTDHNGDHYRENLGRVGDQYEADKEGE